MSLPLSLEIVATDISLVDNDNEGAVSLTLWPKFMAA